MKTIDRRQFILAGGVTAATVFVGIEWKWLKSLFETVEAGPWDGLSILTRAEWRTLTAFADTVIPRTKGPSASESGVLQYLTKLFSDQLPQRRFGGQSPAIPYFARYVNYHRKLLGRLDEISDVRFNKSFHRLSSSEKIEVVTELSNSNKGQVGYRVVGLPSVKEASDADLFSLARSHVVQGYFGEPKYGGNKDYLAWESVRHTCHFNYPKDKPNCPPHVM